MRVAFADLNFSWPPNGGADIDACKVMQGLTKAGHEVRLYYPVGEGAEDRGVVTAPAQLGFSVTPLRFETGAFTGPNVAERFRSAVASFAPAVVFAMHGFTMKPWLLEALRPWPLVSRYYAHELMCARDPRRFRDGAPCPHDYLRTPEICRRCALQHLRGSILSGVSQAWTADYLGAEAYRPEHHARTADSLGAARVLVVSNASLRDELMTFHPDVRVIPGGAEVRGISPTPPPVRAAGEPTVILMPGRADDPLKGLAVLNEAGRLLWETRQDFVIRTTHYDHTLRRPWLDVVGWLDHSAAMALYTDADIVAVPSIWQEPFGLVAVEAMAHARPVVASHVGGLADIVRHEETGLLVAPGDAKVFAEALGRLLDAPKLRAQLGHEGRAVAEAAYDWAGVIERHYLPLLEELTS